MIKKDDLKLSFIAIVYSFVLLFILINNFFSRSNEYWRFFYTFTQQSNILVLVWLVLFVIGTFKSKRLWNFTRHKIVMLALTVYISITFLIVLFVLNPVFGGKWNPFSSASEFFLHSGTPLVMLFYFFFVKAEGKETTFQKVLVLAGLILIYPLVYVLMNLVVGYNVKFLDGNNAFAYNFINPTLYANFFIFILVILGLVIAFYGLGVLFLFLKSKFDKSYSESQLKE